MPGHLSYAMDGRSSRGRDIPLPRMYAASLFFLTFSLAHGTFLFAHTGAGSNMGYKTSARRARTASVGPCLGSPFRLLVVLSTVALSRGRCPRSIPSKQSVPLFIHLPPSPSVRSSSRSAPVSGPAHSPFAHTTAHWPPGAAIPSPGAAVLISSYSRIWGRLLVVR
jgi:hypothetical protein